MTLQESDGALVHGDAPLALAAPDPRFVPAEAVAAHHAGRLDAAARLYEQAIEQQPGNFAAFNLLASVRHRQGDLEQTARLLGASLRINPRQPAVLNNRGAALRELERLQEALVDFDAAIALSPDFRMARANRRWLRDEQMAILRFEQAAAGNPELAEFAIRPPAYLFCYHKTGTILFSNILRKLAARYSLIVAARGQLIARLPRRKQIVLFYHSIFAAACRIERPFRAVRIIRDPRDIWISSYFYHCRCSEPWCTHVQFDRPPPIGFPQADASMVHLPEAWKQDFLARLEGRSYQQNLLQRDQEAGLQFELAGYTGATLEAMRAWPLPAAPELLQVKLEAVVEDFDATMTAIFRHIGFSPAQCRVALELAATEDIGRMDDAAVAANPHIRSREASTWRGILTPWQVAEFERRYGDLIVDLGYPLAS